MSFRPEEVSAVIQKELSRYSNQMEVESRGTVLQVGDGIARVWGLEEAMAGELLFGDQLQFGAQRVGLRVHARGCRVNRPGRGCGWRQMATNSLPVGAQTCSNRGGRRAEIRFKNI